MAIKRRKIVVGGFDGILSPTPLANCSGIGSISVTLCIFPANRQEIGCL
jgi:hypothetical protein